MEGVWGQTFCTVILGGWKGGPWSPELLGGPKLVGGTSSLYHVWIWSYKFILCSLMSVTVWKFLCSIVFKLTWILFIWFSFMSRPDIFNPTVRISISSRALKHQWSWYAKLYNKIWIWFIQFSWCGLLLLQILVEYVFIYL